MVNIEVEYESCAGNQFSFKITAYEHRKRFNVRMPEYFVFTEYDRHYLFLLVLPILSHLVAFYPRCKIRINDYLPEKAKEIFKNLVSMINANNMFIMQKDITKPEIVWEERPNSFKLPMARQLMPEKYDTVCYMSCGKDSTLVYCLMEAFGDKILPYLTQYPTIAWNRGGQPHADKYLPQIGIKPHKAFININQQKPFYHNALQKLYDLSEVISEKVIPGAEFDSITRHFYSPSYHTVSASISAILGTRFGIKNICPGDEKSLINEYQGVPLSESLMFGQSPIFHKAITDMFGAYDIFTKVWSPVIVLNELFEWEILDRYYYNKAKIISSCLTQINRWCYMCEKCFYTYFYLTALGIDPMRYGFEKEKLYAKHKWFKKIEDLTDIVENKSHYAPNDKTWQWILVTIKNVSTDEKLRKFINTQTKKPCDTPLCVDESFYQYIPNEYRQKVKDRIYSFIKGGE